MHFNFIHDFWLVETHVANNLSLKFLSYMQIHSSLLVVMSLGDDVFSLLCRLNKDFDY